MTIQTAEEYYKAQVFTRYDDSGFLKFFSKDDFPGLRAEAYRFPSSHGHTLSGCFYSYPQCDRTRLIVFDHGLGEGGHRSYLKEIERLCSLGFLVFAYDHTGCMDSGGANTGGFSQSLCDLDDCLKALKSDDAIDTTALSVMGHSWGGYAALNIAAYHRDLRRIVAISGFISVKAMIRQNFPGIFPFCRSRLMRLETASNPAYAPSCAVKALRNTDAHVLVIHSDDDPLVHKSEHFDVLQKALGGKTNIEFLALTGKGHNPNYSDDAVACLFSLTEALAKGVPQTAEERNAFRDSFDWERMTAQDEAVWDAIEHFLG